MKGNILLFVRTDTAHEVIAHILIVWQVDVAVDLTHHSFLHTRRHGKLLGISMVVVLLLFLKTTHEIFFFQMQCWHMCILRNKRWRTGEDVLPRQFITSHYLRPTDAHYYDSTRSPLCAESLCPSFELRPLEEVLLLYPESEPNDESWLWALPRRNVEKSSCCWRGLYPEPWWCWCRWFNTGTDSYGLTTWLRWSGGGTGGCRM